MPLGLVYEYCGLDIKRHIPNYFSKIWDHRVGVAKRQDRPCALAQGWENRFEDASRYDALIVRCRWTCIPARPLAHDFVLTAATRPSIKLSKAACVPWH